MWIDLYVCQGFSAMGNYAELAKVYIRKTSRASAFFWDKSLGDHLVFANTNLDTIFIKQFCVHNLFWTVSLIRQTLQVRL